MAGGRELYALNASWPHRATRDRFAAIKHPALLLHLTPAGEVKRFTIAPENLHAATRILDYPIGDHAIIWRNFLAALKAGE